MIASGTSGTCVWSISDSGHLAIAPSNSTSGYLERAFGAFLGNDLPWYDYRSEIRSVSIEGTVRIRTRQIFGDPQESGDAAYFFVECGNLSSITGLSNLLGVTDTTHMFNGCSSLATLNFAGFDGSGLTYVMGMFMNCPILSEVTFDNQFTVPMDDELEARTGFVGSGKSAENQTNGIIVTSDLNWSRLTASQRQGTWLRLVDSVFTAEAVRSSGSVDDEDGDDVKITTTFATSASTSARTLSIYKKAAGSANYPATPVLTKELSGNSGIDTTVITDVGDDAYDFMVQFYDGTNTFMSFPSVQSNIRLIEIDDDGNVDICTGYLKIHGEIVFPAPIGTILDFAGPNVPEGYKECNGQSLLRADYPLLFAALGGTNSPWGLPDSTHFNLPDLRWRTAIGDGSNGVNTTDYWGALPAGTVGGNYLGERGGEPKHTLTNDEIPKHTHGVPGHTHNVYGGAVQDHYGSSGGMSAHSSHSHQTKYTGDTGSGTARNRVIPNYSQNGTLQTTTNSVDLSHTHTINHGHGFTQPTVDGGATTTYEQGSGNGSHSNMPPYAVVKKIIRAI